MKSLSFKVMEDGQGSGLSICYLSSSDHRLIPIERKHAAIFADILTGLSESNGAIIVWFACEDFDLFPNIVGANKLSQPTSMKGSMEPVYWKFCNLHDEFPSNLPDIWNSFTGLKIYPSNSENDVNGIVYPHFFDMHDEKRLGLDPESQELPQINEPEGFDVALSKMFQSSLSFVKKLDNPDFREELMNPFRHERNVELVRKIIAYCHKNGHDEEVHLEILTSKKNPEILVSEIFKNHNLHCDISKEIRSKWG